ncbi:MAG: hypothetical protein U0Z53_23045 [Blastocatellia bacterium]
MKPATHSGRDSGFDPETERHIRRHRRRAARRSPTRFEAVGDIAARVLSKLVRHNFSRRHWPPDEPPPAVPMAA